MKKIIDATIEKEFEKAERKAKFKRNLKEVLTAAEFIFCMAGGVILGNYLYDQLKK